MFVQFPRLIGPTPMNPQRILISIPNWVGDVVMATAALRAIRRRFHDAKITHLMRPYVEDVLEGTGFADEVVFWPDRNSPDAPSGSIALIRMLRRGQYDLAVLMTNSFRSALVTRLAGINRRVGYARDGRSWLLTEKLKPRMRSGSGPQKIGKETSRFEPVPALDYYNDITRHLGCDAVNDQLELAALPADEAAVDRRLGAIDPAQPLIVLNPGANYGSAKCWPAEYYAELAGALQEKYGARVVASLSPKEQEIAVRLAAAVRRPIEIFVDPPLGLGPLKALVKRCQLLITNDTGPRHFAAAFNVPVVTIFGSSDPAWTETRFAKERIVSLQLDCQPCMQRTCPLVHHNCMKQLTAAMVMAKVDELLPVPSRLASVTVK